MLDPHRIHIVDEYLDSRVSRIYQTEPHAQDWARVAKLVEEAGEAISELIAWTGQNPRKMHDPGAFNRMLKELADAALTGVYALQHFTKDTNATMKILQDAQKHHSTRLGLENE